MGAADARPERRVWVSPRPWVLRPSLYLLLGVGGGKGRGLGRCPREEAEPEPVLPRRAVVVLSWFWGSRGKGLKRGAEVKDWKTRKDQLDFGNQKLSGRPGGPGARRFPRTRRESTERWSHG